MEKDIQRRNVIDVLRSMDGLWWSSDTIDEEDNQEEDTTELPDLDTENSTDSEDIQSGNTIEDYETEGQHDGLTIQNAMLAVYNYLQEQNTLQNIL